MTQKLVIPALLASLVAIVLIVARGFDGASYVSGQEAGTGTPTTTATATSTPDPDEIINVTIVPTTTTLGCGGSAGLTISVETNSGDPPDGTEVTLTTDLGTLTPTTVETTSGGAFANLTAPGNRGGIATVTAEVDEVSDEVTIAISCGAIPAQLDFPTSVCSGSTASVTFSWTPVVGASTQWLDLSLSDNGFAGGTFVGYGPLGPTVDEITWNGLIKGLPHFWRVNALTPDGWITSLTGAFVPCGGPEVRFIDYTCTGGGRATVRFFWAPPSPVGSSNWLDLTLFDNGFAPGTFIGAGLTPTQMQLTWTGILTGYVHYWRVNSLIGSAWDPSSTGSFFVTC